VMNIIFQLLHVCVNKFHEPTDMLFWAWNSYDILLDDGFPWCP
jgi:hypothetical protein